MILSELKPDEVKSRLCNEGLVIRTGPFNFRIISSIPSVSKGLNLLYADYAVVSNPEFVDFTVTLAQSGGLRRFWRSQVTFVYDGERQFAPLPIEHTFPLLEWAMNWCIATQAHHYLTLHAAVMEREGCAVIMPAPSGSGKSTLCAALVNRGWRLLSDEMTLISLVDGLISPLGRPISLKNQSLDVIEKFVPGAVFSQVTHDTLKGSIGHLKAQSSDVAQIELRARPRWVVFPRYVPESKAELAVRSKANSMLELGRNSFNYSLLGLSGFELLADVISASDCYDFTYSRLEDAVNVFDKLSAQARQ